MGVRRKSAPIGKQAVSGDEQVLRARRLRLQAIIGNYAVPILEEKQVWGTNDQTRTAYLDSTDVARMTLASLRCGRRVNHHPKPSRYRGDVVLYMVENKREFLTLSFRCSGAAESLAVKSCAGQRCSGNAMWADYLLPSCCHLQSVGYTL